MSEIPVVPQYPGAVALNGQETTTPGGGGGALQNWASEDPPEVVAAFFGERLGAGAPVLEATWPAAWHLSSPDGGEHHLEVWPADGAYPFRDDVVAPPPPGARTVVHEASYRRAPHAEPTVGERPPAPRRAPAPRRPVMVRWRPATLVWVLAAVVALAVAWWIAR